MIRKLIYLFMMTLLMSPYLSAKAADTYTLDPNHTYVLWHVNHFGFSNPSGKWAANGILILDEANPKNSKVNVTIKTADIVTGIKDLDEHLQNPLFFDVKQYPTATFVSDKIEITGKTTAKVHGILTLHGVSKPITLEVTLNKIGINPISNKKTVGFTASTHLLRSNFDINTLLPGISDDVNINIEAEAFK
jgi:polyisoprenoid-binding protein YceI